MSKTSEQKPVKKSPLVTENAWQELKQFTSARIALGRSGNSIPTNQQLSFQLDHARAIDAVHRALDVEELVQGFVKSSVLQDAIDALPSVVSSKATDRMMYLQRPDLGRQINEASWQLLVELREENRKQYDIAIVVLMGFLPPQFKNMRYLLLKS